MDEGAIDGYDASYFDLEKVPSSNSKKQQQTNNIVDAVKFETDVFDVIGPTGNGDYSDIYSSADGYGVAPSSLSSPASSPSSSNTLLSGLKQRQSSSSKVPIRNVLDIFQELKLSFGRAPTK